MRIVVDTNVLLDLWVFGDPAVALLRNLLRQRRIEPLSSVPCADELTDVLARPQFRIAPAQQRQLADDWAARCTTIVRVFPARFGCSDSQDQKFVDLAVSGGASLLVTRDRALLRMDRTLQNLGVRVFAPGAALDTELGRYAEAALSTPAREQSAQPSIA